MEIRFFVSLFVIVFFASVYGKLGDVLVQRAGDQCGVEASTNLIHKNPWLVYLEYVNKTGKIAGRCDATLITRKHMLTAYHCAQRNLYDRLVARLGEYDVRTPIDCVDGVCADPVVRIEINTNKIHVQPGYDGLYNDIAILEMMQDAPYTNFIRPICLPTGTIGNVTFESTGWGFKPFEIGYSDIKKVIKPLPIWTTEACRNAYPTVQLPKKIICAGGLYEIDTCLGDSGSPLMLLKNGRIEAWGITISGSTVCGWWNAPGIYVSVVDYLDWIKKIIKTS